MTEMNTDSTDQKEIEISVISFISVISSELFSSVW